MSILVDSRIKVIKIYVEKESILVRNSFLKQFFKEKITRTGVLTDIITQNAQWIKYIYFNIKTLITFLLNVRVELHPWLHVY